MKLVYIVLIYFSHLEENSPHKNDSKILSEQRNRGKYFSMVFVIISFRENHYNIVIFQFITLKRNFLGDV